MKYQDFTRLYELSKTIRFELRPVGRTREYIEQKGFLQQDKLLAQKYKLVKSIIDEYHKFYISRQLAKGGLQCESTQKKNSLSEYCLYRQSRSVDLATIQANLRKQIIEILKSSEEFKSLFGKELIEEILPKFVESDEERDLIKEFEGFTIYFTGFNSNRKNMYSDEAKSTSIAYRIINENLPKFVDNIEIFGKIIQIPEISANIEQLFNDFKSMLAVKDISELFELNYYNKLLTQNQIEIYNAVIGGRTDSAEKIKGLNEYINLYNQRHKDARLPKFKVLYKQILSDREQVSWLPEKFETANEMLNAVREYYFMSKEYIVNLKVLLENMTSYDVSGIFLRNDQQIANISKRVKGDWQSFKNAIISDFRNLRKQKRTESYEKYEEVLSKQYSKQGSYSVAYINNVADCSIEAYFAMLGAVETETLQRENLFARIENAYIGVSSLLANPYPEDRNLNQDKENCMLLKDFLDSIKELLHYVKPLCGTGDESEKDARFYGEFIPIIEHFDVFIQLYDKVRNFVTRKPYSIEKIKLNFENSQLLGGWDKNKEETYLSIILRKDSNYYLAIMDKSNNKLFGDFPSEGECYEKMVYKQIPAPMGIGGFIRKCAGTAQKLGWIVPEICFNKEGKIIIKDDEAKGNLKEIIDCQKDFFDVYEKDGFKYKSFDFRFKSSEEYEKLSDFYGDVLSQGYRLWFQPISVSYVDSLVADGKLYLFQIYNKDFSPHSKGTPNMHTLYWKMLFDERNLADVVYKLNGQAELFYRESSLEYRPTHKANIPMRNKNAASPNKERTLPYDLVKDKRYTVDKFLFHVPLTLNFNNRGIKNLNSLVREYLKVAEDTHVIGIDRGERNLLYLVVVDSHGKICEQISLNEIRTEYNGNTYKTDYHSLLDKREKERLRERQNWQEIEGIKELKEGYLSQVVHKVAELMVKYKAIVVLEDLNMGFMRGRQKVEKSVYQQFEKMLINKFNYLVVDKKSEPEICGGLMNAYQFTNFFESFEKLGKQSGFLFYVPAWNTSKIDPQTGFVNMLDLRYENVESAKAAICKFDIIRYNEQKGYFEFYLDYEKFTSKAIGTRTKWVICTNGTRIETFRNSKNNSQWDNREVNLTSELVSLFECRGIDIRGNLKDEISHQDDKAFFNELLRLLRLTMQMRNSITDTDVDYIISPVADENGEFFDSRNASETMPENADANGAYNIARKGLMIIEQIKQSDDCAKVKLDISNKRWLQSAQGVSPVSLDTK
jgi:CRISPR-associated protein Cpf1